MSGYRNENILRCDNSTLLSHNTNSDAMAASYIEISFQSGCPIEQNSTDSEYSDAVVNDDTSQKEDCNLKNKNDQKFANRPVTLLCDKFTAFPYDLEGLVRKEGEMTHFVAENLEYKIKLSSPITKRDINQTNASSKNSTPPTSAGILQLNLIDSNVLGDIEIDAQYLAASVDNLTENLYNLLHSVSSITADNVEIHKNSVNKLTDNMDANIKCMYTIMAKTEEISKSMKPTEQLALRIHEIKRLVDMLEYNL